MRIISGKFKGRHFTPPSNITARPTTDFAKESLFNLVGNMIDIESAAVLDLFAGTGSISLECVSRGCSSAVAVEMSERQIAFIKKMTGELQLDNLKVVRSDVFRFLKSNSALFDFIFADPPYQLASIEEIPDAVFAKDRLTEDGIFVLEHGIKTSFERHPNFIFHRNYGNVHFSFFKKK
ncbi:MAG: 16S rRNA (guanine(966)-N(2))-methyltransferase RsmD [Sphingobacteriia bacterium]|jgi:16S rRNA (guanine966-N2)-methyltransferase|nr:16S rRNA (guanine(966)-N(2))-methyltransferase RsmD [Paludibacteraceae bacterium]NCA78982.1 16S rRNA (guanine(966)-N(2))-methyltransferase RsmD [Sphingobacteriia bacterium]